MRLKTGLVKLCDLLLVKCIQILVKFYNYWSTVMGVTTRKQIIHILIMSIKRMLSLRRTILGRDDKLPLAAMLGILL